MAFTIQSNGTDSNPIWLHHHADGRLLGWSKKTENTTLGQAYEHYNADGKNTGISESLNGWIRFIDLQGDDAPKEPGSGQNSPSTPFIKTQKIPVNRKFSWGFPDLSTLSFWWCLGASIFFLIVNLGFVFFKQNIETTIVDGSGAHGATDSIGFQFSQPPSVNKNGLNVVPTSATRQQDIIHQFDKKNEKPILKIDSSGVTVNGIQVSYFSKEGHLINFSDEKLKLAMGNPLSFGATKVDGDLYEWAGMDFWTKGNLMVHFRKRGENENDSYKGVISVDGVPISAESTILTINAALEKKSFKAEKDWSDIIWVLDYENFSVKLRCDKDSKKVFVFMVEPKYKAPNSTPNTDIQTNHPAVSTPASQPRSGSLLRQQHLEIRNY